jgi:hypothetical protein
MNTLRFLAELTALTAFMLAIVYGVPLLSWAVSP